MNCTTGLTDVKESEKNTSFDLKEVAILIELGEIWCND